MIDNRKKTTLAIMVFLLLYYIYMNVIRKVMIPGSGVVVPMVLALLLGTVFLTKRKTGLTIVGNSSIRTLSFFWMAICAYITVNNISITQQLIYGGMIQLYVMVCFFVFVAWDDSWFLLWKKWSIFAGVFYASTTILFFFNHGLYSRFINFFYPELAVMLEKFYGFGWMSGICDHFSTNGMVLATGFMALGIEVFSLKEKNNSFSFLQNKKLYTFLFIVLYGLILSSKRSPLICSSFALGVVYFLSFSKKKTNAIITFSIIGVVLFLLYEFLLPYIPGLSTIADKFQSTSNDGDVLQGRNVLWAVAFDMIESSPIVGHGFGSYALVTENMHLFTTSAHNYYLQVFAELGFVGLFLYVGAFVSGLKLTIGVVRRMIQLKHIVSPIDLYVVRFSLAFQCFVLLYNMSATALMYYVILIPYFLSLSAACIISRKYKGCCV